MLSKKAFYYLRDTKGWKPKLVSHTIYISKDGTKLLNRKLKYNYTFEGHEGFEYQTTKGI